MIGLRYFKSHAQYFVMERSIGWRILGKIEFLQGYGMPGEDSQPAARISESAGAASQAPPQEVCTDKITSRGSQVESDFMIPEWHNNPNPNAKYDDIDDIGHDVPEVFREHRHNYSSKPEDINAYRK